MKKYYKQIYTFVYRQTGNEERSKDLTQEIFISMLKSLERYDSSRASFKTWLYKIAGNKIVDSYRSKYYMHETLVEEIDETCCDYDESMEKTFEIKEDAEEILNIVNTLSTDYQEIFRLKVFGDMTFIDISSLLEIPESTVKTRYYSTVRKIKKMLEVKNGER